MLDSKEGTKVAEAIDRRITNVAKQVYEKSPVNKTEYGIVQEINNGVFTVKIKNATYTNVYALRNVGTINIGNSVICLIPNNQYSNMVILGVADGTLSSGSTYTLPQMTNTTLGGAKAIQRTDETTQVAIESNTGLLYAGNPTNMVDTVSAQTISGSKTFSSPIILGNMSINASFLTAPNLNTLTTAGFYGISQGTNIPTGPSSNYGELIVFSYRDTSNYPAQLYIVQGDDATQPNRMYVRSATSAGGTNWTDWEKIAYASDISASGSYIRYDIATQGLSSTQIQNALTNLGQGLNLGVEGIVSKNVGQNGYIKYQSGLKMAWGHTGKIADYGSVTISFSSAGFLYIPALVLGSSYGTNDGTWAGAFSVQYDTLTTTGATLYTRGKSASSGRVMYWMAIGY